MSDDNREALRHVLGDQILTAKVADALTQAAAAVMDARDERDHWRKQFGLVQQEVVILASVVLKGRGRDAKLIVRLKDFEAIAPDLQLHVEIPEGGVRVYRLRAKAKRDDGRVVLQ